MNLKKKIIATALSGLAIAGIVAATTLAFPPLTNAQTATPTAPTTDATVPSTRGERNGLAGAKVSNDTYLADALGITADELQTAQTTARGAELKQAVADGLITQAQADAMLNQTAGPRGARDGLRGVNLDHDKYLAEALGITVDELNAAQEKAAAAELAQAVTDGRLTQAQADQITAERALQKYIADKGLFKSAVDAAVKDGVITQAQADTILAQGQMGLFGGGKGHGGFGDGMGRGGFDGGMGRGGHGGHGAPGAADQTQDSVSQQGTQS